MAVYKPPGNPVGTTPKEFKTPPDARDTGGEYPNYSIKKTRSGHVMIMDDTLGSEHITLQHRGGSMIQFTPDGKIVFTSQNGQYNVIFGENRMLVTGAYDVAVQGSGSLVVDKDYDVTVKGNYNMVVHGDMNMTVKNLNQTIRGNMDMTAKDVTMKMEGSTTISSHGITNISSDGGASFTSTSDSVFIAGKQNAGIKSGRKMMVEAGSSMHMKSSSAMNLQTGSKLSLKGGSIAADGSDGAPNILLASGASESADAVEVSFKKPTSPNRET
jgi:hypothetical protein